MSMHANDVKDLSDRTIAILGGNAIPSKRRLFEAARRRGLRIVLIKEEAGWERDYCDAYLPLSIDNYVDIESVTARVVEFCQANRTNGITTTHDSAVPVLAEAAHILGHHGPTPTTAAALRNKEAMRRRFAELGVPSAESIAVKTLDEAQQAAEQIGYPVIVKPSVGTASAGVLLAKDSAALTAAYETSFKVGQTNGGTEVLLIEEYLEGMEVTVDALVFGGEILFHNISDHPQEMPGPHFAQVEFVTPTSASAEVEAAAYAAHEIAIRGFELFHNIVHTEMRMTSRGPRVIELHPRPAGQRVPEITSRSLGVDLMGSALEIAVDVRPTIERRQDGYAGYRCICPSRPGVLTGITGVEEARAMPGIFDIELTVAPGARVYTVPESNQQDVAYVFGHGATYEEARSRTAAADEVIGLEIA